MNNSGKIAASLLAGIMIGMASLFSEPVFAVSWQAKWLWQSADGPDNTWIAFRKTCTLSSVPSTAVANIGVDSKYWLWINGQMVVFEGGMARGPSPGNTYYDEVDIAGHLKTGENTIAVLAWHWGRSGRYHKDSGKGGMIFQAQMGGATIVSDNTWKMKVHPAYSPGSGGGNSYVPPYNVLFDAQLSLGDWTSSGWTSEGYSDTSWGNAIEKGTPSVSPWYDLVKNPMPSLTNYGLADYASLKIGSASITLPYINPSASVTIEAKLPFNKQITPYLEVDSPSGNTIAINTDNPTNYIQAAYITKSGIQSFESYSWMNGHIVKYTIPAGVTVRALKYRWTGIGELTGTFQCSDPFYERLWWMARNTLYVCARDNYMDCPDRERGLWIGDVADQCGSVFYILNEPGRILMKKAILQTVAFKNSSGHLAGLAPGGWRELPCQSLQFIAMGMLHYYKNTGDIDTIAYAYPAVFNYLHVWNMQANGLPDIPTGSRTSPWSDWGDYKDHPPIQNAWYYIALKAAKEMALLLGKTSDISWYDARIVSIENNFNSTYWQGNHYGSSASTNDDRANALAIVAGLAESSKYDAIVNNSLIPVRNASPHFEWIVEEAMCIAGKTDKALERMKIRYASQVNNPDRTTLDEYAGVNTGGTYNHAWNCPHTILSRHIAGIAADEVGWSKYHILPRLVHLTSINTVVPSPKGNITVNINVTSDQYKMDLVSPSGTTALVGIPKAKINIAEIKANGTVIWTNGSFSGGVSGITWAGEDAEFIKFNVSAGAWTFMSANAASSKSIGINHKGSNSISVTLPAGYIPQSNWNNIEGSTGTASNLMDSDGALTTAGMQWESEMAAWSTNNPASSGNEQLMNGYLDADARSSVITVSGIPYTTYNVLMYHESQNGDGRIASYELGGVTKYSRDYTGTFGIDYTAFFFDGFATQSEAEAASNSQGGNLILFENVNGSSFTLIGTGISGSAPRCPIQGIQIVSNDNPLMITTQPLSQETMPGQSCVFTVSLSNPLFAHYVWYRSDDAAVDTPGDDMAAGTDSNSLTINPVTPADEGYYYCVISSGSGTAVSDVAGLVVKRQVAHWTLDSSDFVMGQYMDTSGQGHHASASATPTFVTGQVGQGIRLLSNTSNPLSVGWPNAGTWNPSAFSGQFSVSFWLKWAGAHGKRQCFVSKNAHWEITVGPNSDDLGLQSPSGTDVLASHILTVDEWCHLIVTFDGLTGRIYKNGLLVKQADFVPGNAPNGLMALGWNLNYDYMNGILDDIQIYNYPLNVYEAANLYYAGSGIPVCLPHAPLTYDFNDDCIVNMVDFALFASGWLDAVPIVLTQPNSIGFDFGGPSTSLMGAAEVAGAPGYVQANWNSTSTATVGSASNLKDKNGDITPVSISWNSPGTYRLTDTPDAAGDKRMMKGYLDQSTLTNVYLVTVTVEDIPWNSYDVVVYTDGQNGASDRIGLFSIVDPSDDSVIVGPVYNKDAANAQFAGTYTQTPLTSTTLAGATAGNFIVFENLTSSSFRLEALGNGTGNNSRAPVNAIQIGQKTIECTPDIKPQYDLNADCTVDLSDFVLFAQIWLDCGLVPICVTE